MMVDPTFLFDENISMVLVKIIQRDYRIISYIDAIVDCPYL